MSITTDYTAVPASALIDKPLQCPGCGQPLKADHDWGTQLRATGNRMLCCLRGLTVGEANVFLSKARAAREGAKD